MYPRALLILLLFPVVLAAQPSVQWRKAIKNGVLSVNKAVAITVDKDRNVFTAATTHEGDSAKKILLVKLDSTGNEQWRRVFQADDRKDAGAVALALDPMGNAILTGTVKNVAGNTDIVTLKYTTDGILLWQNFYVGSANMYDAPSAVAVDRKGNVFVCGYETASEANQDLLLIRYLASGEKSFVRNFITPKMDVAVDVAADDSCNVYVCGSVGVSTRTADILVMKFDSTGYSKWNYVYDGAQHAVDMATDISLDDSTAVWITGSANHANDRAGVPIIRLNRNGKLICEQVISEGVTDGIGNSLVANRKTVILQATITDYMEQTVVSSIHFADRMCNPKLKFKAASEDVVYLEAYSLPNNTTALFGSALSRPENTIAPYIEVLDSLRNSKHTYRDDVLISLLRIKDVLLTGRDIYFLGDDATEHAGTISVAKYSFPEEPKKKPKATNLKAK